MNRLFLCRSVALFVALLALVLLPSHAGAAVSYRIEWLITEEDPTCETADLGAHDGEPFFSVNKTPLPTFQIPGALANNPDGSQSNVAVAGFDSVLLFTGDNRFGFSVSRETGDNTCVHSRNLVSLVADELGLKKTLFNVRRDGTAFAGTSDVAFRLEEINPELAKDLKNLEVDLAARRKDLIENAAKIQDLARKLDAFEKLDAELQTLANQPLDEIDQAALDGILDRYADILDETTRAALEQFVLDLKKSIGELKDELQNLIDVFDAQAESLTDLLTKDAQAAGFDPDAPESYALGPGEEPWVAVPDISDVPGAFSSGNDPYAAYAEAVIAALAEDVQGGKVVLRADFVATVRAWRANDKALAAAIKARAMVSQAETDAFLNAHNAVVAYVQTFMDASGWLKDAGAPPALRAYVDGVLKVAFKDLADEMKDHLNLVDEDSVDLTATQLFQTITAFSGAMSAVGKEAKAYADVMQTLVLATGRIAVGFVPVVGPVLDLCECVTGKQWCLPSGKTLSTEERVFAGAGVAISGVAHYWAGVKAAGISPAAVAVADEVAKVDAAIAQGLHANPRTWYKTLEGACSELKEPFEKTAGRWMQEDGRALIGIGDDGVRDVLDIPRVSKVKGEAQAPDFLSVTKGNKLALSEVKSIKTGSVDLVHALDQLENGMKKLAEKGLAGDVERVEFIMPKGAPLNHNDMKIAVDGTLVRISTGERVTVKGFKNFILVIQL